MKDLFAGYKVKKQKPAVHDVVDAYLSIRGWDNFSKEEYERRGISYARLCGEAKKVLQVMENPEDVMEYLWKLNYQAEKIGFSWTISTLIKKDLKVKL